MYNRFYSIKGKKGFTLVELLAVIVILAIIMLIAIPAVLSTLESARRKTFGEYVDKSAGLAQKQFAEDQLNGSKNAASCYVYNIKTELNIADTGNFDGWVLINPVDNDIYITLFNNDYVLIGYHYSDSSLNMEDYFEIKTTENVARLTVEELCKKSSCSTCNADGTEVEGTGKKVSLIKGIDFNNIVKDLAGYTRTENSYGGVDVKPDGDKDIEEFVRSSTPAPDGVESKKVSTDDSDNDMYMWFSDNKIYYYTEATRFVLNEDSSNMFANLTKLKKINTELFDTSKAKNIQYLFYNCNSLGNVSVNNWNTSRMVRIRYAFSGTNITEFDASNWDVRNVEFLTYFVSNNSSLVTLNLSNWKLDSFNNEDYISIHYYKDIFNNTPSLKNLILDNWSLPNCTDLSRTFYDYMGHYSATDVRVSMRNWNLPNVETTLKMFRNCGNVISLDITGWYAPKLTECAEMFFTMRSLTELIGYEDLDVSKCSDFSSMFYVNKLKKIDLSKWKPTNVTSMYSMFDSSTELEEIDLTGWNTSNVTNMTSLFSRCPKLKNIYVDSGWNTNSVTSDYSMFSGDVSLPNYDSSKTNKEMAYIGGYLKSH